MTMPIHDRVRPILCDPLSGENLRIEGDAFVSDTNRYPIVKGVPRFVPGDQYVRSFSFEWNTHSNTQLDCFRGDTSSEAQFVQKTGFSQDELRGKLTAAGFSVERATYANTLLMPLAAAKRAIEGVLPLSPEGSSDVTQSPAWLNAILTVVMRAEARLVQRVDLPTGVSAIALAQRR